MTLHRATTWAAGQPRHPLEAINHTYPAVSGAHVGIAVSHCGLCASDLHLIDGDWGDASVYPQVCGHEVVGTLCQLGADVKGLALGQRVGVGWYKSACLRCECCRQGDEQHCAELTATCTHGQLGGLADYMVCDSRFVFPIPANMASEHAAPLLCAGVTVYTALRRAMRPGMTVGVVGLGGLGHLAVQFAAASGCPVTALSLSPAKREQAKALGAGRFIDLGMAHEREQARNSLDFIMVTSSSACDWAMLIDMLRPRATLCFAGMPPPVTLDVSSMMYKTLSVTTANVGGRQDIRDTLAFAAQHQVLPWVQQWPMDQVNEAIQHLRDGDVRYRAVLCNPPTPG